MGKTEEHFSKLIEEVFNDFDTRLITEGELWYRLNQIIEMADGIDNS